MPTPVEGQLRTNEDSSQWGLVIRGRPLTVESLLGAAGRARAEFAWRGAPFSAVSAEVTGLGRPTEAILAGRRLRTRAFYASASVAAVVSAGFSVLATFAAPHVSIVLPEYDEAHVRRLLMVLGPEMRNPYYEMRRRS